MKPKFHHYGLLVRDIEESIKRFQLYGYTLIIKDSDPLQKANLAILENTDSRIELVSPHESNSSLKNLLNNKKDTGYHLCYSVDSTEKYESFMKEHGAIIKKITKTKPAKIFNNKMVTFYYIDSTGIIEIFEDQK